MLTIYLTPMRRGSITGDCSVASQNGNGFRRFQGNWFWSDLWKQLAATECVVVINSEDADNREAR
jgi:hypothetical protein